MGYVLSGGLCRWNFERVRGKVKKMRFADIERIVQFYAKELPKLIPQDLAFSERQKVVYGV